MPSLPMLVRLLARSSDGWPPVEVSGGGYRPQVAAFTGDGDGELRNDEPVRFPRVPAHTSVGVEVSDRARVWSVPALDRVAVADGAEVLIPAGALRVSCVAPLAATGGATSGPDTVAAGPVPGGTHPPVGARLGSGAPGSNQATTPR